MRVRYDFSSRRTRRIDPHNQHRMSFPSIVKEVIRISDIVLEIIDARYINETRNIEIEEKILSEGKKIIFVINKIDMVEKLDKNLLLGLKPYVIVSAKSGKGIKDLRNRIKIEVKKLNLEKKGYKRAHVGIVGYPNTGKSSIINKLTGRVDAPSSSQAGFTKGMRKVRLMKGILIIDTPGAYPEKENSQLIGDSLKKHFLINVRNAEIVKEPEFIVVGLMEKHANKIQKFYEIDAKGDSELFLDELGRKRKFLKKGGIVDRERTARLVLKDWQNGKVK